MLKIRFFPFPPFIHVSLNFFTKKIDSSILSLKDHNSFKSILFRICSCLQCCWSSLESSHRCMSDTLWSLLCPFLVYLSLLCNISSGVFFPDKWCPEDPKAFQCFVHITSLILVSRSSLIPRGPIRKCTCSCCLCGTRWSISLSISLLLI